MTRNRRELWLLTIALLWMPSAAFGDESPLPAVVVPSTVRSVNLARLAPFVDKQSRADKQLPAVGQVSLAEYFAAGPLADVSLPSAAGGVAYDTCPRPGGSDVGLSCEGWTLSIDYLNWKPRQRGMDFAVAANGTALTVGSGRVHNLELARNSGIRGSLGYQTKTGWSLTARYTDYDTRGTATVERPPGNGELFATRSHPDTNEDADIARAAGDFDYRLAEIEAGHSIYRSPFADIRVFGGVRYSEIGQRMHIDYDGRDFVNGVVQTGLEMDGFGLQIGSEGTWRLPNGFGLFGRISTGLARGSFQTSLFESNLDGAQLITDTIDAYDQAVPTLELSGGVSLNVRNLELAAGYEYANWFDLSNRSAFVDDIHEGLYGPFQNNVLLEGLFVRVSYFH